MSAAATSADDVRDAISSCAEGQRVLPVGGATKPALSSASSDEVVSIDVSGLRGITEYDPAELTLTAGAGTPVAEIGAALAEHGQYLPFDPPLARAGATLGGAVAAGASGPGALRYGGVRDFVIGVRFVDGTGRVAAGGGKVVKNAAGFDFPKLMVGSAGRLGVLLEVSVKVFPAPRETVTLRSEPGSPAATLRHVVALARAPVDLEALDVTPEGEVLARLGGDGGALAARAARLAGRLGPEVQRIDDDARLWADAAELGWAAEDRRVVRVPMTARAALALGEALAAHDAPVRYSLAMNVAWVSWAADGLDVLAALLSERGLVGVPLTGGPAPPLLGDRRRGGAFAARVRGALDPFERFLDEV